MSDTTESSITTLTRVLDDRDAMREALRGWLAYAERELGEFDVPFDECTRGDGTDIYRRLCPKCQDSGCIQRKIRQTRALIIKVDADA